MYNKIYEKGIDRIEHFLDVDLLMTSRIDSQILTRRLLNKQQR